MEQSIIELKDGKYVAQVQAMKKDIDEPSAMAPYLANNVIITCREGTYFLTLMIQEEEIVTGFQIQTNDNTFAPSIEQQVDDQQSVRYEIFQVERLLTILPARVQYKVNHECNIFEGDEALRLLVDLETIQNVEDVEF